MLNHRGHFCPGIRAEIPTISGGPGAALAHQVRHEDLLERFPAIAELVDPAAGVIRLRSYDQVSRADVLRASYLPEQSRYVGPDGDRNESGVL